MVKIAVVGGGLIGQRHLQVIQATLGVKNCALVDIIATGHALADTYGIGYFTDLNTMLDTVTPDGVIIATPNHLHMDGAMACIERSIPVLIEKPLATHIADTHAVLDKAQQKNVPILTGYFRRYHPAVIKAKQTIDTGTLGQLVSVHAHFWGYKPAPYFETAPWRTQTGGGPIHINLSHDLDLLLYFMGDIDSITAISSNAIRKFKVEDTAGIICTFKNGAMGTLNVSDTIPSPWSWEATSGDNPDFASTHSTYCMIGGTKASLDMPHNRLWYHTDTQGWTGSISTTTLPTPLHNAFAKQIAHFADVIRGTATPAVTGEDGVRVMQVIDAITESINKKCTVYI